MKKAISFFVIMVLLFTVGFAASGESSGESTLAAFAEQVDMSAWQYNEANDVYWQIGISYCRTPADASFENLGIFVPGAYFTAVANGDGTYTCQVNSPATVGGYTAATAPIVIPVNTPGHSSMSAPTGYSKDAAAYTSAGFVYVSAGCRSSKELGMPVGVVDIKAAIRYIRSNDSLLPGDCDSIFVFGMSGGGSQCAVLGASGDSALYDPYLEAIGAVQTSDAIAGVMAWCPITGLDSVDLGHEWSMGVTRSDLDEQQQSISDALAGAYKDYINGMGFTDEDGNLLLLEASEDGIDQAGSYYDYLMEIIEESLEHYITDNAFPMDGYDSAEDYIEALNGDDPWIDYDAASGSVSIRSQYDFTTHCKLATKPVAAFDKLEQGGHLMFGYGDGECSHFDTVLYDIIRGTEYEAEFAEDFARTDEFGNTVTDRLFLFSPLSYLSPANEAYGTSVVAPYWRIRSGISQGDTPLTSEVNLVLGLRQSGIEADFETVWALGHTQAERTGDSESNFIAWVNECLASDSDATPVLSGEPASAEP